MLPVSFGSLWRSVTEYPLFLLQRLRGCNNYFRIASFVAADKEARDAAKRAKKEEVKKYKEEQARIAREEEERKKAEQEAEKKRLADIEAEKKKIAKAEANACKKERKKLRQTAKGILTNCL